LVRNVKKTRTEIDIRYASGEKDLELNIFRIWKFTIDLAVSERRLETESLIKPFHTL